MAKNYDKNAPSHGTLLNWLQFATLNSQQQNWEYFVIDQYLKGNQNITANPVENSITIGKSSDEIAFPINKMFANFRAMRTFVLRNQPKIEMSPDNTSEEAKQYARRQNAILRRDDRLNNSRKLNKDWVYYGIKYGVSYRQIGFDKERHCSIRWTVDPWDMLFGAKVGNFEDAPYIIKPVIRTIDYWKKKYPDKVITPDNEVAYDQYKKLAMQIDDSTNGSGNDEGKETALGFEAWYIDKKKNNKGGNICKSLFTLSESVDFSETPFEEYPFVAYKAEVPPNQIHPEPTMKHLIAPQRLENTLNQQLVEYNDIVNKGRFSFAKDSGFEVMKTKQGQLIRHALGRNIEAVPIPPLSPALQFQLGYADEARQYIGAQNDATLGKTPFAGASGDLVEALQSGDANQLLDFRENFEDALSQEATMILKMYDLFEDKGFAVEDEISKDKVDSFYAVGRTAGKQSGFTPDKDGKVFIEDNGSYVSYMEIAPDNNVKVTLTSDLGETKQARLNFLSKLVSLGLPLTFLLKNLEFPDIDDIEQRIAEEAVVQMLQEQGSQQSQQNPLAGNVDVQSEEKRIQQKIAQGG